MHHSGAHYIITSTTDWPGQIHQDGFFFYSFTGWQLKPMSPWHIWIKKKTIIFAFVSRSAVLVCTLYENLCDVDHTDWSRWHYPVWRSASPWGKFVLPHVEEFCWCPIWQQGYCSWTCRLTCWQGCLSRPSYNWWLYGWSSATVQIRFLFTSSLVQMLFSQSIIQLTVHMCEDQL